ncbi:hypothetical protein GQX73_g3511 [Xylaria multiplex]|uniref:Proteasome assembly chaperone 3 n=1 Tax=Xylaria multiplex TaxID=323545 RepID=A0A7C8MT95_9PEZI|nr:hypothetical protein GQX73_g3511 [Xylaria multiplex]
MESNQVLDEPFPATSKHETGQINGIATEATALFFADRILIQVPLSAPSPAAVDMALANESLLPMSHLTPKTLLGGGGEQRESLGQLYAVQIASYIVRRDSDERRTLVVGLGLQNPRPDREAFFDLLELIQKVL